MMLRVRVRAHMMLIRSTFEESYRKLKRVPIPTESRGEEGTGRPTCYVKFYSPWERIEYSADNQVRRATGALLKHVKNSRNGNLSLLEEEGDVIIAQIALHKIPDKVSAKPTPITIPHPLRRQDDCDMCLFVKDDAKAWIKEMVEKEPMVGLAKEIHLSDHGHLRSTILYLHGSGGKASLVRVHLDLVDHFHSSLRRPMHQIIKLQKLRTQFREFKNRRELLSQYDMFLADDRILPMLTKALGKSFLKVKKQPVPISLRRRSSLAAQIDRARKNAFLCGSNGDCWVIKLANTKMTEDEVVENLVTGLPAVVNKIPRKWKNVKSINIKTSDSIALPVYSNVGDIPLPSPSEEREDAVDEAMAQTHGKKAHGSKTDTTKEVVANKRTRKPRALIRQQLQRIKEDMMAEKRATATATASPSSEKVKPNLKNEPQSKDKAVQGDRKKSRGVKRAASESTEGPDKTREGSRSGKVDKKSKQKSLGLSSVAVKGAAVAKRRKAEAV